MVVQRKWWSPVYKRQDLEAAKGLTTCTDLWLVRVKGWRELDPGTPACLLCKGKPGLPCLASVLPGL
jgi:hypothetical protein